MKMKYLFPALLLAMMIFASCKKDKEAVPLPPGTCQPVSPKGHLSFSAADGLYTFRTKDGGVIVIDPEISITISHDDYPNFKIELWGAVETNGNRKMVARHENLNGKHVKNRIGAHRTILFPDNTKLTIVAESDTGRVTSINISDGVEAHRLNLVCNTLELSSTDATVARQLDEAEADGETGAFEFTATGLVFVNVYTEDVTGNKMTNRYLLGEIFLDEPTRVNDYYDDPRLNAT